MSSKSYCDPCEQYPPFFVDGPHMMQEVDAGEGIFHDSQDDLVGDIFRIHPETGKIKTNKKLSTKILLRLNHLRKTAESVGRIVILYQGLDKQIFHVGTGIRVAPRTVLTAQHNVKNQYIVEGLVYNIKEIYFIPYVTGDLYINDLLDDSYRLELPGNKWVDNLPDFDKPWKLNDVKVWETKNDFAFLDFTQDDSLEELFTEIAYPICSFAHGPCFVVAYPGHITLETFRKDFGNNLDIDKCRQYYEEIKQLMNGFERKIISYADGYSPSDEGLHRHPCPTTGGTSGGLFVELLITKEDFSVFSGLHIGGSVMLQSNYAVPVIMPVFGLEYSNHVLLRNKDWVKDHCEILRPFFQYHRATLQKYLEEDKFNELEIIFKN
jgi:hypothetical protein